KAIRPAAGVRGQVRRMPLRERPEGIYTSVPRHLRANPPGLEPGVTCEPLEDHANWRKVDLIAARGLRPDAHEEAQIRVAPGAHSLGIVLDPLRERPCLVEMPASKRDAATQEPVAQLEAPAGRRVGRVQRRGVRQIPECRIDIADLE